MPKEDDLLRRFVENSQILIHDVFLGTDQLAYAVTQTASVSYGLANTVLNTGVMSGSTARLNYVRPAFNPLYGRALVKLQFSSLTGIFAYFGFRENLTAPTIDMTESHAGFFISGGVIYWSTGNGDPSFPNYKNVAITQLDPSREIIYDIRGQSSRWFPLPLIVPSFDGFAVKQELRKWSSLYQNSSCIPDDKLHYFTVYIANTTGYARTATLRNFTYAEDYPD